MYTLAGVAVIFKPIASQDFSNDGKYSCGEHATQACLSDFHVERHTPNKRATVCFKDTSLPFAWVLDLNLLLRL